MLCAKQKLEQLRQEEKQAPQSNGRILHAKQQQQQQQLQATKNPGLLVEQQKPSKSPILPTKQRQQQQQQQLQPTKNPALLVEQQQKPSKSPVLRAKQQL